MGHFIFFYQTIILETYKKNTLKQQILIVFVKMKVRTWNLVRILIFLVKFQKYNKYIVSVFLCVFLEIPLFYCLQTIENNRKHRNTMGTIDFLNFLCENEKYYYFKYTNQFWCYHHHYSEFYGWFHRILKYIANI